MGRVKKKGVDPLFLSYPLFFGGCLLREKQVFSKTPPSKNSFSHLTAEKTLKKSISEAYRLFEKCPFLLPVITE
jgi:hypothetical protein